MQEPRHPLVPPLAAVLGGDGVGARLPALQPGAAAQAHLAPSVPVVRTQGTEHHARPDELGHDERSPPAGAPAAAIAVARASRAAGSSRPERSPGAVPVTTERIA